MEKTDNQNQTVAERSKRDIVSDRLRQRHPDAVYDDDDALYSQINDDYDDYDSRIKNYEDREAKMADMFNSDPRSAAFLINWRDGEDPLVELVRQFGSDITEAANDPDRIEAIAEANKEYAERVAKNKELQEQYEINLEASLQALDDLEQNKGIPSEDIDAAMQLVLGIVHDGLVGVFKPETVMMALKAVHHDRDVQEAADNGEIRGRNAKIDMKLRERKEGDGVPQINGAGNAPRKKKASIFDLAATAK